MHLDSLDRIGDTSRWNALAGVLTVVGVLLQVGALA
jgi:hypothetical protein